MGMGGGKDVPAAPAAPEAEKLPTPENSQEPTAKAVRNEESRKLSQRRGASGNILTDPLGTGANSGKTLLG
jgi:hypothetical protein